MIYKIFHPSQILHPFIKYYWYMEDLSGNPQEKDLLIPDLSSELIFNYDSLYHRYAIANNSEESISKSCIVGQRSKSIFANRQPNTRLLGVKFKSGALFTFFGIPEKELKDASVSLANLDDTRLLELEDKVLNQKDVSCATELLDQYFGSLLVSINDNELRTFKYYLKEIDKLTDVSQLEAFRNKHAIHYKKLERLFFKYGGVSARNFIRINRFKKFYKSFNKSKHQFYNSSIYDFGYYDQNHFIKDFTFFTHQNPSQYYKLETELSDSILIQTLSFLQHR